MTDAAIDDPFEQMFGRKSIVPRSGLVVPVPPVLEQASDRSVHVGGTITGDRNIVSTATHVSRPNTNAVTIASTADRDREAWQDATRGNVSWFTLFSGDITPTSAMSAGIMDVPPDGGVLEPHRHEQAEIYFVVEGTGVLTIDGVATTIIPGTAAFIPGDAEHSVRNESTGLLRIFYVFPTDSFAEIVYRFPRPAPNR
jgi:mannose-6-phosphate isomerase-like protein (cupin superfamily)